MTRPPPKEFMDATMRALAEHGAVQNPAAVAAATWRKMGKKAREPWNILRSLREKGIKVTGSASPVTALAPLAPEIAFPAAAATHVARSVTEIVTGDIVVIHSTVPRGTKKNPLPPLEVEYHINLAALGIGALAIALAAFVGVIAWEGTLWTPALSGLTPAGVKKKEAQAGILDLGIQVLKNALGLH